jgi:hypothetical protein
LLLALAAAAIVLSGCGGSASSSSPSRATDAALAVRPDAALAVRPESAASALPAVIVHDLGSGQQVQLKNLLPAAKPVLVWFWAPH